MPECLEVKADLPGPFPKVSILPSYNAVQLIRPGATICHLTKNVMREEEGVHGKCTILCDSGVHD